MNGISMTTFSLSSLTSLFPPQSQPLQEILLNLQFTNAIVMYDGKSELEAKPVLFKILLLILAQEVIHFVGGVRGLGRTSQHNQIFEDLEAKPVLFK